MHVSARAGRRFRRFRPPPTLFFMMPPLPDARELALPRASSSWTWFSTRPRHRAMVSMNVVAQMRPWPAQEKMVYTTVHNTRPRSPPVPTTTRTRSWTSTPTQTRTRCSIRVGLDRQQPGAEHQRHDKLAKRGSLALRAPAYLVPTPGTALDSPPLQAQVVGAACARRSGTRSGFDSQMRSTGSFGVYALSTIAHDVLEALMKSHQYLDNV
ncbi:hypothetical protein B0H13DRAFT_1072622 [Mycena leptocephala]|nr:hypothetical protein B0H13DRAFT_1072622 [Mycena leptocephala]